MGKQLPASTASIPLCVLAEIKKERSQNKLRVKGITEVDYKLLRFPYLCKQISMVISHFWSNGSHICKMGKSINLSSAMKTCLLYQEFCSLSLMVEILQISFVKSFLWWESRMNLSLDKPWISHLLHFVRKFLDT